MIKLFVGELSGMFLFNSTCAPHVLMIFLMVSPPVKTKTKVRVGHRFEDFRKLQLHEKYSVQAVQGMSLMAIVNTDAKALQLYV